MMIDDYVEFTDKADGYIAKFCHTNGIVGKIVAIHGDDYQAILVDVSLEYVLYTQPKDLQLSTRTNVGFDRNSIKHWDSSNRFILK